MSDHSHEDVSDRLVRSAIPGRPSFLGRRQAKFTINDVFAPGRPSLELSVLCSALAILIPVLALGAGAFAVRSGRQGHPRWRAALVAAIWCGILGLVIRVGGGMEIVP